MIPVYGINSDILNIKNATKFKNEDIIYKSLHKCLILNISILTIVCSAYARHVVVGLGKSPSAALPQHQVKQNPLTIVRSLSFTTLEENH